MHDTARAEHSRRPSPSQAAATAGLRRVERVRVLVSDGRAVADVTGVAHRYPYTFGVSLSTAARLADAGVPLLVERPGESKASRQGS